MGPTPSRPRATSVAWSVAATHDADRAPSARHVVSNSGVGAMLAAGLAGGRIPWVGAGAATGWTTGAGCTTGLGAGCTTGLGGAGGVTGCGGGGAGGAGGGGTVTAATWGAGVVVVGAGGGGVVVVGPDGMAFSASRIFRIASRGDSLRAGRGAVCPGSVCRFPAAATALGPAVAASTAAPGIDTMRPMPRRSSDWRDDAAFCRSRCTIGVRGDGFAAHGRFGRARSGLALSCPTTRRHGAANDGAVRLLRCSAARQGTRERP